MSRGECTKYFLSLEERNKVKSHIRKLRPYEKVEEKQIPNKVWTNWVSFIQVFIEKCQKSEQECIQHLEDINTPILTQEK